MKRIIIITLVLIISLPIMAQKGLVSSLKTYNNPDELVTIAEYTPFDNAIEILSKISEQKTGRRILSTAGLSSPIGVEINKLPYMKALVVIVQYNNLEFEERENGIIVRKKITDARNLTEENYASVDSKEVKISAVFFEADVTELRERGINWNWLLSSDGVSLGTGLTSYNSEATSEDDDEESTSSQQYLINGLNEFTSGDWTGSVEGVFKFFETENLGEVIARPKVTVRDKMKGRIQIGSDISIKQLDFAGNVVEKFFSTGTIIEVTPYIYNEDNQDYVLMKVSAERSSAIPGEITTEIKKTQVSTDLLALSGEEKVIGGLFINEEVNVRQGIPFLKDLPWWVFGIRYLTGYDKKQVSKKEVIILLKAEIIPTLKERVAMKKENEINKMIMEDHEVIDQYKVKPFRELENDN